MKMNCCIITRMIKFACMALLFGACCPAKGEVCELLGFQPYLQQKGIFAGPEVREGLTPVNMSR